MRKYLDIPLTLIVTAVLTVAMLWPIHQPPPAPDGSDKRVHLIAFAALAFPLARTGRIGLLPSLLAQALLVVSLSSSNLPLGAVQTCRIGSQILQA